jgi:hypothetical protein
MDAAFHGMMVHRQKPPVDKQQRDVWLGHDEKRAANAYEAFDPEYLADCMQATERSSRNCKNTPNAPCLPASRDFKVVWGEGLKLKPWKGRVRMVGVTGIEPVTPTMST